MAPPKDIMTNSHAKSILNAMNALRKSNTLCDVTLRVEHKDFPAHRIVLAACSDYFCAMFTSEVGAPRARALPALGASRVEEGALPPARAAQQLGPGPLKVILEPSGCSRGGPGSPHCGSGSLWSCSCPSQWPWSPLDPRGPEAPRSVVGLLMAALYHGMVGVGGCSWDRGPESLCVTNLCTRELPG